MSEFRDRVVQNMLGYGGHPARVHGVLSVLGEAMREKTSTLHAEKTVTVDTVMGMQEMTAFVCNLADDIAHEYGIQEGN